MKTAISIPDPLFEEVQQLAGRLGLSRSELISRAVERYLRLHRNNKVKEALDRVYAQEPSTLDPALEQMQRRSLPREDW